MCSSHTDVIAALVMNAQNMDEKIILIFSLSVIPINNKSDYQIVNACLSYTTAEVCQHLFAQRFICNQNLHPCNNYQAH